MTDLTNKIGNISVADMQVLYTKYTPLAEFIGKYKDQVPYLLYVIDAGVEYIKKTYVDLSVDWKAWAIVYLKHMYLKGHLKKEEDISATIDEFVKHYNEDYKSYIDDLALSASEFDRDYGFVCKYIWKKNG